MFLWLSRLQINVVFLCLEPLLPQIILHPPDRSVDHPTFTVDDGSQPPITVMCKERNVLVATFSRLLLTKIGQCCTLLFVKSIEKKRAKGIDGSASSIYEKRSCEL